MAMPDERLGERACAFVVAHRRRAATSTSPRCARSSTQRKVAKQYWPERVEEIDEMPRTPSGKIQKFVLRERAKGLRRGEPRSDREGADVR